MKILIEKKERQTGRDMVMARLLPHKKGWVGWGKIRGELKPALN